MMKLNFSGGSLAFAILAIAGIIGVLYVLNKAKGAATTLVTKTLNPASDQNLAYTGVNSVVHAVTGDKNATLGTWAYDATHDAQGNLKAPWNWGTGT